MNNVTTVQWQCRCPALQQVDGDVSTRIEHTHISCTCGWLHLIPVPVTKVEYEASMKQHDLIHRRER